tara:strand:+ start:7249 stop:7641 length:393 start_codon:yes stop_codon:yes gene_type:complete
MNKLTKPKVTLEHHTAKTLCYVNDIELYAFDMVGSMMNPETNEVIRGIDPIADIIAADNTNVYVFSESGLILITEFEQIPEYMKRDDINTTTFTCRVLVHKGSLSESIYLEEVSIYEISCIMGHKENIKL